MRRDIIYRTLRLIFFIPISILMYFVAKFFIVWDFTFISESLVHDLSAVESFGDHFLLGPIYVFICEFVAVGVAVYTGVFIAPGKKKIILGIYIVIWLGLLFLMAFTMGFFVRNDGFIVGKFMRNLTEVGGEITGLLVAAIYILKEQKELEDADIQDITI